MTDGRKRALLIGNSHFADARLARLFAPAEDVDALRSVLADPAIGGFDAVEVLLDQPLQPVRRAIASLCAGTTPNELLLLYYTGHGILTAHNDFYLALGETTVDLPEADGLEAAWLRARLDRCRARRQVLVLDCCHSGAFMAGRKAGAMAAVTAATFAHSGDAPGAQPGLGRYVLTASDAQSFAWDASALKEGPTGTDGRTSLFTRLLVRGLMSGDAAPDQEFISVQNLYDYVYRSLPSDGPAMSPQFFVDGGKGEVILARNPVRLREDLLAALNNADVFARLGAVAELEEMLRSGDAYRIDAVRRVLTRRLEVEEHVRVYKRIEGVLATKMPPPVPPVTPVSTVFRDVDAPWCPELVVLPAGEFLMGSPAGEEGRYNNEGPQHRVRIDARFALGRYPVTFEEYDHFCAMTKREMPGDEGWGRGRRPVINVSWRDAVAYCEWLSRETGQLYRLPSEAEWEYGCRAGTTTRYSFGDAITPKQANYDESKHGKTTEVGGYPANPWGLYDMHGNVWEWVGDVRHDTYQGAPTDGSAWTDNEGIGSSRERVYRGGSWNSLSRNLRSAIRNRYDPVYRDNVLCFRVARTLD